MTAIAQKWSQGWIVSPGIDLLLVIATPLAIVPLVGLALHHFSPELIFIAVASFASIGHHLPGFMRAYGDRALFERFRLRFLLAPPLIFAAAWLFAVKNLHGLEFVLLFWATWHILMQTYGLMRIYDLKRGLRDPLAARLDFAACLAVFAVGIVFSQSRLYTILEIAIRVGLPLGSPEVLPVLRAGMATAVGLFLLFYAGRVLWQLRGDGPSWAKLCLLLTTGWLYWTCGALSTNLLIGVAMFEIFHAAQYYAVVWAYNRRLADRVGPQFGPLRFLFARGWLPLVVYGAAIAAFGSLKWIVTDLDASTIKTMLLTLLITSTTLHFYYDGFIWKVRETATQQNLDIQLAQQTFSASAATKRRSAESPGWLHVAKWGLLVALIALLYAVEASGNVSAAGDDERYVLATLLRWTPDVPELLVRESRWSLAGGDVSAAIATARRAAELRPNSADAQAALGTALLHADNCEAAADALSQAVALRPEVWENHYDLGQVYTRLQRWDEAEAEFAAVARRRPQDAEVQKAWADLNIHRGDLSAAVAHYRAALEISPADAAVRAAAVQALIQAGEPAIAVKVAEAGLSVAALGHACRARLLLVQALRAAGNDAGAEKAAQHAASLDPNSAEAIFQLGVIRMQLGDMNSAEECLRKAISQRPEYASAHMEMGTLLYLTKRFDLAEASFRRSIELSPRLTDAHNSLGATLLSLNRLAEAQEAFEAELVIAPNNSGSHFNLGLLAVDQNDLPRARKYLRRAEQLGRPIAPKLRAAAGMD